MESTVMPVRLAAYVRRAKRGTGICRWEVLACDYRAMEEPHRTEVGTADESDMAMPIRLSMRNYFSTNFLWTALHTSQLVAKLEAEEGERPRFDMAHRSLAATSVVASGAFLEATPSELFQDAHDGHGVRDDGYIAPLRPEAVAAMAMVWRATNGGRTLNPVQKWQWLLECCGQARLENGAPPVQDAALLTGLRNALVHFKPENIAADEEHDLERRLRGKFRDNRLMEGSPNPWWPSHGLGHGCTEWAVRSARALSDQVLAEVGITPNYQRIEAADWNGRAP
jgi:hypothetical protein